MRARVGMASSTPPPNKYDELEKSVKEVVNTIWECMVSTDAIGGQEDAKADPPPEAVLRARLGKLMGQLRDVDSASRKVDGLLHPQVIETIDRGGNPMAVMKNFLETANRINKDSRARVLGAHTLEHRLQGYLNMWDEADAAKASGKAGGAADADAVDAKSARSVGAGPSS